MYKCENVQMVAFVCTIQQMQQKKVKKLHIYTLTKHLHINNALAYFPS